MPKALIHSNAPHALTGYGVQTDLMARWLVRKGWEVVISSFYGLQGAAMKVHEKITVLPASYDSYGNDILIDHFKHHQPDFMMSLIDVWVLDQKVITALPLAAWIPIDHDPIPPSVLALLQHIPFPIAMSRFGEARMTAAGVPCFYLPHVFDADVYKPIDRVQARLDLKLPADKFIIAVVAANKGFPDRKNLRAIIAGFAAFHKAHPNALLYLHTEPTGVHSGLNVYDLIRAYGLTGEQVKLPNLYGLKMGGYAPEFLNKLYNAADVKLSPSAGEGFGVTDLDAQAAGCPVIVTDFTAQKELGAVGYRIPVDADDLEYTLQGSFQVNVPPSKITAALEHAFNNKQFAPRQLAHEFAQQYEMNRAFDTYLPPILEAVMQAQTIQIDGITLPERQQRQAQRQALRQVLKQVGDPQTLAGQFA